MLSCGICTCLPAWWCIFLGWEWGQSSIVILMLKSTFKGLPMALLLLWSRTQWQEHSLEGDGWVLRGRTGGVMQTWKMWSKEKWEKTLPGRPCVSSLNVSGKKKKNCTTVCLLRLCSESHQKCTSSPEAVLLTIWNFKLRILDEELCYG